MLARNIVGQRFMPFVTELSKDVLEETAEEKLDLASDMMNNFKRAFQAVETHEESVERGFELMTPEIQNHVLSLAQEAYQFFKQGKHLFMYRRFVDCIEALDIAERKLSLGMEILWGLYGRL